MTVLCGWCPNLVKEIKVCASRKAIGLPYYKISLKNPRVIGEKGKIVNRLLDVVDEKNLETNLRHSVRTRKFFINAINLK